jgi:hypothetical protein
MDDLDVRLCEYFSSEPIDPATRARIAAMITAPAPPRHRRAAIAAVAGALALAAVLSVVLTHHQTAPLPAGGPTPTTSPTRHGSLTDREFSVAVAVARHEADQSARSITSATATVGTGTVTDSNTGHRCTSGTLLHITLIGDFKISVGGRVPAGSSPNPAEYTVTAMLITADPTSGQACLISAQTGPVTPEPDAALLFTH